MIMISFEEAAIRGDLHINKVKELADLGYFKVNETKFNGRRIDQDSFDQYLANQQPPVQEQQETITGRKEDKTMIDTNECVKSPNGKPVDKITRYGWTVKDGRGKFMEIPKELLVVDHTYQRSANRQKIREIQSDFSWIAFCCIAVALRAGRYYVIDGQHRQLAAMSRSDIDTIPCMVFESVSIEEEAKGFLSTNTLRKPIASIDGFKARLVAGDEEALYIDRILRYNIIRLMKRTDGPLTMASVAACFGMVRESRPDFDQAVSIVAELCQNCPVHHFLIQGMYYLSKNLDTPLTDTRLRKRILSIGADGLVKAANKAVAYHDAGGSAIWSKGMLDEINKRVRTPFKLKGDQE
jgi:hypothetical protein